MDLEAKIDAMFGKTPRARRAAGRTSFKFPWIHPKPKVWKLYLHHFTAEVSPAPYNYDGPQTWMADMWIGSSTGGTNSNRIDVHSLTPAEARRKVEAEYRKLARMKSWLLDLPVGPTLVEGGKRRHGHGGKR